MNTFIAAALCFFAVILLIQSFVVMGLVAASYGEIHWVNECERGWWLKGSLKNVSTLILF